MIDAYIKATIGFVIILVLLLFGLGLALKDTEAYFVAELLAIILGVAFGVY